MDQLSQRKGRIPESSTNRQTASINGPPLKLRHRGILSSRSSCSRRFLCAQIIGIQQGSKLCWILARMVIKEEPSCRNRPSTALGRDGFPYRFLKAPCVGVFVNLSDPSQGDFLGQ